MKIISLQEASICNSNWIAMDIITSEILIIIALACACPSSGTVLTAKLVMVSSKCQWCWVVVFGIDGNTRRDFADRMLPHRGGDKMAAILQTKFSNSLSWMKFDDNSSDRNPKTLSRPRLAIFKIDKCQKRKWKITSGLRLPHDLSRTVAICEQHNSDLEGHC